MKEIHDLAAKKIVPDGCMITYSGLTFDLFNPSVDCIKLEDIAHGLAYNCRWNGATKTYFSIAEHCCMAHDQAPDNMKTAALFHDCEEAYWGDIIKPLKALLPVDILNKMWQLRDLIFEKYHIPAPSITVKQIDFDLLLWDYKNMILNDNHIGWLPGVAEKEWLKRANNCIPCQK